MKYKIINLVLCLFLLFFLLYSTTEVLGKDHEVNYDWEELRRKYDNFIEEQNGENKKQLYNVLPSEKIVSYNYERKMEVMNFIFENSTPLEELAEAGDLMGIKILFRLKFLTDGAKSTWVNILIGSTITSNPENFLIALEGNLENFNIISPFLVELGEDFLDNFEKQAEGLLNRYMSIKGVEIDQNSKISTSTKNLCLYFLSSAMASAYKMNFYIDGTENLIESNY